MIALNYEGIMRPYFLSTVFFDRLKVIICTIINFYTKQHQSKTQYSRQQFHTLLLSPTYHA